MANVPFTHFLKVMLWTVLATHVIGPACYSIPHLIKAPPFLPRYSSPTLVHWVCTWPMSGSVPDLCGHKNELYRDGYVPKSGLLWVFFLNCTQRVALPSQWRTGTVNTEDA